MRFVEDVCCTLGRVAHDAAQPRPVLDEVKLVFAVVVDGVGEFLLVAVHHVEAIFVRQRRYLAQDLVDAVVLFHNS